MTDTPKFTVVDRRKFRGDEESVPSATPHGEKEAPAAPAAGPRLTLVEPVAHAPAQAAAMASAGPVAVAEAPEESLDDSQLAEVENELGNSGPAFPDLDSNGLPPAPSPEETRFQQAAYDQSAQRLEDLVRAQNPGAPAPEKIGFEHLVQQLYLSAMMQMGAGTPEGQRPRIDILGARQTIDLLGVVLDRTKGNLSAAEESTLQTVLFELRFTFLELTRMISAQPAPPTPPPSGGARR